MKIKVLSLVSVLLVFLCIMGCTGGQDVGAGITEASESTAVELSDTGDVGDVSQTDVIPSETVSDSAASASVTSTVSTAKALSTAKAKTTTALTAAAVTTEKQTTTVKITATTKPAATTNTVTTTKATTKAATTTKATTTATTTKASGGSVIVVEPQTTTAQAKGTVTLYISCKKAVDYGIREQPGYDMIIPADGVLLTTTAELESGDTVMTLLVRTLKEKGIALNKQSDYVRGIGGLNEKDCGPTSGWLYSVNGAFPSASVASYKLSDGDSVRLLYSIVNGDVAVINT